MERLAQGIPSGVCRGIGPEERQKGVAPLESFGSRQRQVGEECQALGLDEHRAPLTAIGAAKIERSEDVKPDDPKGGWRVSPVVIRHVTVRVAER